MRYVNIKYHVFSGIRAGLYFPIDEIKAAFLTTGITIYLAKGQTFPVEPRYDPGYTALIKEFWDTDRTFGHIILSDAVPDLNPYIAGELLDQDRRGACAVFTDCNYIRSYGQSAVVQSCVHEIGHLLNLDHRDTNRKFPSAIDQAKDRPADAARIRKAWTAANIEAAQATSAQPSYFFKPTVDPTSLPFAQLSRIRLNTLPENSLQPWGSRFERPFVGHLQDLGP